MPAKAKRSTRLSPQEFVAAAEKIFFDVSAAIRAAKAQAKKLNATRGRPKGAIAMMRDEAPYTREVEAWLELEYFAGNDWEFPTSLRIQSEQELADRWAGGVTKKERASEEARQLRMATFIHRESRKLWAELDRQLKLQAKASTSMIEGDLDPWGSRDREIETLCKTSPLKNEFKRLRPLFLAAAAKVSAVTRQHPVVGRDAWVEARNALSVALFAEKAQAWEVARSQRRLSA